MSLEEEIKAARSEVVSDGYEMSIGEIVNLYRDEEIRINPEFQRLFRWDESRKTRFLESILLGIPVPPIFVYQDKEGVWELIDGLQRLSTIFEFIGVLRDANGDCVDPSTVSGTMFLPSLEGKRWNGEDENAIGIPQQLQIKRARMRVEILKQESDPKAKYELFQRLNTGGDALSPQEVRNCVAIMIDSSFFDWLKELAEEDSFTVTTSQTGSAKERQTHVELALRFLAFRNVTYRKGLDVHEYLDHALIELAEADIDRQKEADVFRETFGLLRSSMEGDAFKRWDGTRFSGKFLHSVFEVVAVGVSKNLAAIEELV